MAIANLTLRFIAELAGIAAVAYAGFAVDAPSPVRAAAAIGTAVALIATWAIVVAPTAANGLSQGHKDLNALLVAFGTDARTDLARAAR